MYYKNTMFRRLLFVSVLVFILSVQGEFISAQGTEHPRLFFEADDLPTLREQAAITHQSIWRPVISFVQKRVRRDQLPSPPLLDTEESYFVNQGKEVIPMAFACLITEREDICDLAVNYLLTQASWARWGYDGEVALGTAHMVQGTALAYDWLYNRFTPEQEELVRYSLATQARRLYLSSIEDYHNSWANWWPESYVQNHYWSIYSALGLAGFALSGEPSPEVCFVETLDVSRVQDQPEGEIIAYVPGGVEILVLEQLSAGDGAYWLRMPTGAWMHSRFTTPLEGCTAPLHQADVWLASATEHLSKGSDVLDGINDGSWHESVHYQNYMLTMSLPFLVNLRDLSNIDLLPHDYLHNYIDWRLYNTIPGTTNALLSYGDFEPDWGNTFSPQNVLRFVAAEYDSGHAEWMANFLLENEPRSSGIWTAAWYVFEFLYYDPTVTPVPPDDLSLSRVFPDLQGVIWRSSWDDDALVFGFKAGAYAGRYALNTFTQHQPPWDWEGNGVRINAGHDHDDANTFYLYNNGQWLAPEDVGVSQVGTSHHNGLLIDGQGQARPSTTEALPPDETARAMLDSGLTLTADGERTSFLAATATVRYDVPDLEEYTRYVLFPRPDYLLMVDQLAAENAHNYEWLMHSSGDFTSADGWLRATTPEDNQLLGINTLAPQPASVQINQDDLIYAQIAPTEATADLRFIQLLYPTTVDEWAARPTATLLEDTPEAIAVQVTFNEAMDSAWRDVIRINLLTGTALQTAGGYPFDGRAALIRTDAAGQMDYMFIAGGSILQDVQGQTLFETITPLEGSVELFYEGQSVTILGDITGSVRFYAPGIQTVTVNGQTAAFRQEGSSVLLTLN